jgi:hypothetical protein
MGASIKKLTDPVKPRFLRIHFLISTTKEMRKWMAHTSTHATPSCCALRAFALKTLPNLTGAPPGQYRPGAETK